MSLRDGRKKMSKSDPDAASRIERTDSDDVIAAKLRGAKTDSHAWTYEKEKLAAFMKEHQHPLVRKVGELARKVGGHGGMDFIMNYRLLDCLRQGLTPDMTVYDAADWSSLLEISARSVKEGSMPATCPDFTRGGWKTIPPLGIVS